MRLVVIFNNKAVHLKIEFLQLTDCVCICVYGFELISFYCMTYPNITPLF